MNWEALRNIFLQYLEENIKEWDKDFDRFYREIIEKLKKENYRITQEIDDMLYQFAQEKIENVRALIEEIAVTITNKSFTDPLVKKIIKEVFDYKYPDGLNLSQRLWDWNIELRLGLKAVLKNALLSGYSADKIAYQLQDAIDRYTGKERANFLKESMSRWISELRQSAKKILKDLKDKKEFEKVLKKTEKYIEELSKKGSYYSAKHLLNKLIKAIEEEKEYLIDRSIKYYIYNKQLTRLKTIARTESANIYHKAQIKMTEEDNDLIGYKWMLSKSHPEPDICDYYANVDYGLGKGIYPKSKVPQQKAHVNCMCYLKPVYAWEIKGKEKENPAISEYVLRKFAPKYIKELEKKGYNIKDLFDEERKSFIPKRELLHLFK